jgi:hypothetical protein
MILLSTYIVIGVVTGFLAGLLGLGGGIVVVPALFFVYGWQHFPPEVTMHLAVGSSLATAVFTSMTSTWAHNRRGAVRWGAFRRLVPGILLGGLLGGQIADLMPAHALRVFFGVFEIIVAIQLAMGLKPKPSRTLPGRAAMGGTGLVFGTLSAILGIGGGTMTVPFLVWCNIGIREAVATSAACGLPITFAGTIGHVLAGWNAASLPAFSTGFVYWPAVAGIAALSVLTAPLGARAAHTLPVATLKRIFSVVVGIVGLRMLIG